MSALEESYKKRYASVLVPIAQKLEAFIKESLNTLDRIDRVTTRPKSVDRFMQKAMKVEDGLNKYSDPIEQILDQVGARIVTYYPSDVPRVAKIIKKYFRAIEDQQLIPDGDSEFGYIGKHFILALPSDVLADISVDNGVPEFFELQIKTLFQHAWAEAEHDLGYKPESPLSKLQKRKIAFTAAQAWGADQIFEELFHEQTSVSE